MKQLLFTLVAVLISMATLNAQQIAVVNGSGSTSVYDTLDEAIEGATSGSTIYLPGGGFQVSEKTKITNRITIMGISHYAGSNNADGCTTISGDLRFAPGSDGGAVMGIYLANNINIGDGGRVKNILVKYCNVGSIQVLTDSCPGIYVNQNYVRNECNFRNSNVEYSNNISHAINSVNGGVVKYNTFINYHWNRYSSDCYCISGSNLITNNNITCSNIFGASDTDSRSIDLGSSFVNNDGYTGKSDFHFNETYDGPRNIGVYGGGTSFNNGGLPPMPQIISKSVAEQTDAQGKLKIRVTVKAN